MPAISRKTRGASTPLPPPAKHRALLLIGCWRSTTRHDKAPASPIAGFCRTRIPQPQKMTKRPSGRSRDKCKYGLRVHPRTRMSIFLEATACCLSASIHISPGDFVKIGRGRHARCIRSGVYIPLLMPPHTNYHRAVWRCDRPQSLRAALAYQKRIPERCGSPWL